MNKHTPAPWTLSTVPTSCGICHRVGPFPSKRKEPSHACIYVDYPGDGPIEAESLANAHLIAAAPDLLAALELAQAALFAAGHHHGVSGTMITVDNAIATARGQS